MDLRHTGEILSHLEKQNELLLEARESMSHELHVLQVEEEMLMRKYFDLMTALGFTKTNKRNKKVPDDEDIGCTAESTLTEDREQQ